MYGHSALMQKVMAAMSSHQPDFVIARSKDKESW